MSSNVYVRKCGEYDYELVMSAVSAIFDDAGGVGNLFAPGGKIILKPNLISPVRPEKCATTHPMVLKAVIECLAKITDRIYVGDSPAVGSWKTALEKSAVAKVIKETGAHVADFDTPVAVSHPEAVEMRHFEIAAECAEYDHFITLPKCKTHCHLHYTGALKNQYGVIPGLRKARGHMQYNTRERFSEMLVDVNTFIKPDFAIMDAVFGIEGDGLRESEPRKIGAIIGGADLVSVDSIACRMMSLDPATIPVVREAAARKFGTLSLDEINIVGDAYEQFVVDDYKIAATVKSVEHLRSVPVPLRKAIYDSVIRRPHFDNRKCVRCGKCAEICPATPVALRVGEDGAAVDYDKCAKCYCCHEVCEHGAISLKSGLLGKMLNI